MSKMRAILTNRAINLLCKLFSEYRSGASTKPTLNDLRDELGAEEYKRFESDLSSAMRRTNAWKAVTEIIGEAMDRKRTASKRGA
jgi:hypothetical protein